MPGSRTCWSGCMAAQSSARSAIARCKSRRRSKSIGDDTFAPVSTAHVELLEQFACSPHCPRLDAISKLAQRVTVSAQSRLLNPSLVPHSTWRWTMDFSDRRFWYSVAVVVVIVILLGIAYTMGWFGMHAPPPAPPKV